LLRFSYIALLYYLSLSSIDSSNRLTAADPPAQGELVKAAISGDEARVRKLLTAGADVNENFGGTQDAPITPLFAAMASDNDRIARILITNSHNLDLKRTFLGHDALELASRWSQPQVKSLIQQEIAAHAAPQTAFDPDETAWVANALSLTARDQDYGTLLGLAYITATYQQLAGASPQEQAMLELANQIRQACRQTMANSPLTVATLLGAVQRTAQLIPDKHVSARYSADLLHRSALPATLTASDVRFRILPVSLTGDLVSARLKEETLIEAYRLGKAGPASASHAINAFTAERFNATLQDKAVSIVKKNAANFHPSVIALLTNTPGPDTLSGHIETFARTARAGSADPNPADPMLNSLLVDHVTRAFGVPIPLHLDNVRDTARVRTTSEISQWLQNHGRDWEPVSAKQAAGSSSRGRLALAVWKEPATPPIVRVGVVTNVGPATGESPAVTFNALEKPSAIAPSSGANGPREVRYYLSSNGSLKTKAIQDSWADIFEETRKTNEACMKYLKQDADARGKARQAEAAKQTFAILEGSVFALKTVASFESAKLATQISTIGTAGIQIGKAIATFLGAATTLASCATLVGGVAAGVMMVVSLFSSGPSQEQLILDQIAALSKQVEGVREEMHQRFDAVDKRLDNITQLVVHGFQALIMSVDLAREQLRVVAANLSVMESSLLSLEPAVQQFLSDASERSLWENVDPVLNWDVNHREPIPLDRVGSTLDLLALAATREARDSIAAGLELSPEELRDDSKLAARFTALSSSQGLDSNIRLLRSISKKYAPEVTFGDASLANLNRWSVLANAYVDLAVKYWDYYSKYQKTAEAQEMLRAGREWQASIRSLKSTANNEGTPQNARLYGALLRHYKDTVTNLKNVVKAEIANYQDEKVEGYDLWAGASQKPRQGRTLPVFGEHDGANLIPSEDFDFSHAEPTEVRAWKETERTLEMPAVLRSAEAATKVIDPSLLVAHHLQLGVLKPRWSSPDWDEKAVERVNAGEDHLFGKAAVTVQTAFVENNGGKVRWVFKRRVNTGNRFWYGIQTWETKMVPKPGATPQGFLLGQYDIVRTKPKWGHGNRMFDPNERLLIKEEIKGHWAAMKDRVFEGRELVAEAERKDTVEAARLMVNEHFSSHIKKLEADLWAKSRRSDSQVKDAIRQLTAAKRFLDVFVSLGMSKTISSDERLRGLLFGESLIKGKTRLLDGPMLELLASKGTTLLEAMRDKEWTDTPADALEAYFRDMPPAPEPLSLVEDTMERLALLVSAHDAAQPAVSLEEAARQLKKKVMSLAP
jgi:hypothetical protein